MAEMRNCMYCGKRYELTKSTANNRTSFCSTKCQNEYHGNKNSGNSGSSSVTGDVIATAAAIGGATAAVGSAVASFFDVPEETSERREERLEDERRDHAKQEKLLDQIMNIKLDSSDKEGLVKNLTNLESCMRLAAERDDDESRKAAKAKFESGLAMLKAVDPANPMINHFLKRKRRKKKTIKIIFLIIGALIAISVIAGVAPVIADNISEKRINRAVENLKTVSITPKSVTIDGKFKGHLEIVPESYRLTEDRVIVRGVSNRYIVVQLKIKAVRKFNLKKDEHPRLTIELFDEGNHRLFSGNTSYHSGKDLESLLKDGTGERTIVFIVVPRRQVNKDVLEKLNQVKTFSVRSE